MNKKASALINKNKFGKTKKRKKVLGQKSAWAIGRGREISVAEIWNCWGFDVWMPPNGRGRMDSEFTSQDIYGVGDILLKRGELTGVCQVASRYSKKKSDCCLDFSVKYPSDLVTFWVYKADEGWSIYNYPSGETFLCPRFGDKETLRKVTEAYLQNPKAVPVGV